MYQLLFVLVVLFISCKQEKPINYSQQIKSDVVTLAADEYEGREVGTEGEKKAAEYISNRFSEIGIAPKGTDGFLQSFFVKKTDNPHEKAEIKETGEDGITGYNVIGMIDNASDEMVIIGAHYDHLGMGGTSSLHRGDTAIHNGADDNASGVAAMLSLAQKLKTVTSNRDILFIAFSGEEKGLWGSNYFVKNPTIDLAKVNFMINMDMVGRLDTARGIAISGTGTTPNWPNIIDTSNTEALKVIMKESGVGPSDHTSFYIQDIPVLHFFTGQHEDYHKPSDDPEKINFNGILKISNVIENIVRSTDITEKMAFNKTKDESSRGPKFTVTLGVIPDYLYDGEGMRIDGISDDKPAQKAGILKGDIVIQMGDSTITNMMSYMRALASFKKGDKTAVIVQREEENVSVEVEF